MATPTPPLFPVAPGRPGESRRGQVERVAEFNVQVQRVHGQVLVTDIGEVAVDVKFPVEFTEIPGMSFGAHLADNQAPQTSNFPTVSVVVLRWETIPLPGLGNFYYTGATLGIVIGGRPGALTVVHWHAEGKAFRNPIKPQGSIEEAI